MPESHSSNCMFNRMVLSVSIFKDILCAMCSFIEVCYFKVQLIKISSYYLLRHTETLGLFTDQGMPRFFSSQYKLLQIISYHHGQWRI